MTQNEKLVVVQGLLGEEEQATDEIVLSCLSLARSKIISTRFPFGDGTEEMPPKYDGIQCELAVRYYNRLGAEGEISHNENGINRTFDSVDDADLLNKIIPIGVLR